MHSCNIQRHSSSFSIIYTFLPNNTKTQNTPTHEINTQENYCIFAKKKSISFTSSPTFSSKRS